MRDFKIDNKGKFIFDNNDFRTSIDDDLIIQDVKRVMKSIKKNYWKGADLEKYLGKSNNDEMKNKIKKETIERILELEYLEKQNINLKILQKQNAISIQALIKSPITERKYKVVVSLLLNSNQIVS